MSTLSIDIPTISNSALEVMKRVIDENEKTKKIDDEHSGPIPLASALSDFFQIASSIEEHGQQKVGIENISELADYGVDLLDRLSYQMHQLEILDMRNSLNHIFLAINVWFARKQCILNNLRETADAYATIVNAEQDGEELALLSQLMSEILDAASNEIKADKDQSNPWRPWRVLNLNTGIAATRSLKPEVMKQAFEQISSRLPKDAPGFFADGKRQMAVQNVPDEVLELMKHYANQSPDLSIH